MEECYGGVYIRKRMASFSLSLLVETWTKLKLTLWTCKCCQHNLWLCSTGLCSSLSACFIFAKKRWRSAFNMQRAFTICRMRWFLRDAVFCICITPVFGKKALLKIPLPYKTCCLSWLPCWSSCSSPVVLMVLVGWAEVEETCLTLTLQLKAAHPASPKCNALTVLVLMSTYWRTCTNLKISNNTAKYIVR